LKAVVATRYGGPDVVEIVERASPEPGPRDVRIDVRAASLNPLDAKLRAGKVKLVLPLPPPVALGCDVAGVVSAVGEEVVRFKPGDEVFARLEKLRMGGLAEQVCAHEGVVALKPKTASFAQAAAIPLAGLTALQALRECANAQPGQRVMITAGAGGVGSLAIQIAKVLGLHVITTTSTTCPRGRRRRRHRGPARRRVRREVVALVRAAAAVADDDAPPPRGGPRGRPLRLPVHAPRRCRARRARGLDRRGQDQADHPRRVPARRR
jgi:alcohol dehydrogenase